MTGETLFTIFPNVDNEYQFTVTDEGDYNINVIGTLAGKGILSKIGNDTWTYLYNWSHNDGTDISLSFVGTDLYNASTLLAPQVKLLCKVKLHVNYKLF